VRIVCFPPGGSSPAAYSGWIPHVPEDWRLDVVPTPGWGDGPTEWSAVVKEIADAVVDDGVPTVFFGHCLGAATAFAVAGELRERAPRFVGVSACPARDVRAFFTRFALDENVLRELDILPAASLSGDLRELTLAVFRKDRDFAEGAHLSPLDVPVTAYVGTEDRTAPDMRSWHELTSRFRGLRTYNGTHAYIREHAADLVADFVADTRAVLEGSGR
jgi:surfactin synthase thioesterase subunit